MAEHSVDRLDSLGGRLRSIRGLRGLSLNALARNAGISVAYVQKLERDEVKQPSPHILFRLAKQLSVGYGELMQLAGYLLPTGASTTSPNLLAQALNSEPLTEDEVEALARYLAWYRHSRGQGI